MKLFLYSVFVLLIAPCNKAKQLGSSNETDNSKVMITYQTTVCFGKCPVYKLTINGETKTATFTGEQNTEKIGTYTKSVSAKEMSAFVEAFENAKFNSLNNEYLGVITDFPIKVITYTSDGKTKIIKTRSGAPKELTDLEKMLSDYANGEGWKKSEGSSNNTD